ncbi:Zn-finger nucleic acid-binding protein [Symbiobacterium terraclitae]|uniref:Zn-finger nucleic acid-binding protein n=1 Tax=Symbiobacterium terraclitae TaxID=557451 RepID=A0ABS4JTH9_9FIRM|nr:zf-TFIIB domain-containing protein [Symbiobacterium terraclitae]MBP2018181.1 Zn-finger nucleic acid-binding protein [Symbiobacterium terraclitae]
MRCPLCNVPMREVERRGVRLDVCTECHGVWLDGGELDKLLAAGQAWEDEYRYHPRPAYGDRYDDEDSYRRKKKRKHFLEEIFDFAILDLLDD